MPAKQDPEVILGHHDALRASLAVRLAENDDTLSHVLRNAIGQLCFSPHVVPPVASSANLALVVW